MDTDNSNLCAERNRELKNFFAEHPALGEAFKNDATVHAWLKQFLYDRCTLEEAFIGIIIELAREKKKYFDEIIELSVKLPVQPILLPHGAHLLDQDASGGADIKMPKLRKGSRIALNGFGPIDADYVVTKVRGEKLTLEPEK